MVGLDSAAYRGGKASMTLPEQIREQLEQLPPEAQAQVLEFVRSLRLRMAEERVTRRPLCEHPAFGSWLGRGIDALRYQDTLRAEWDT